MACTMVLSSEPLIPLAAENTSVSELGAEDGSSFVELGTHDDGDVKDTCKVEVTFQGDQSAKGKVQLLQNGEWVDVLTATEGYLDASAVRIVSNPGYSVDWTGISLRVDGNDTMTPSVRNALISAEGYVFEKAGNYRLENVEFRNGGGDVVSPYVGEERTSNWSLEGEGDIFINGEMLPNDEKNGTVKYCLKENGKIDIEFVCFHNMRYTAIEINGTDYSNLIPKTQKELLDALDANGNDQTLSISIEVDPAEEFQFKSTMVEITGDGDEEYEPIGNFLWTNIPGRGDEDDFVDHSTITFVKLQYSLDEETYIFNSLEELNAANKCYLHFDDNAEAEMKSAVLPYGAELTVKIIPDYGYQLVSFGVNGGRFATSEEVGVYTFTVQRGNFHLAAKSVEIGDEVDAESSEDISAGSITLAPDELEQGTAVLTVTDVEDRLDEEQKAAFEDIAEDFEIVSYVDLDLEEVVYQGSTDKDKRWETEISELGAKATVSLAMTEALGDNEVVVLHEHNGVYEVLEAGVDANSNSVLFETNSFSNYAIATKGLAEGMCNVTFDTNGGNLVEGSFSKVLEKGDVLGDLPVTEKAGFEFVGWYTEPNGGKEVTAETKVENSTTFYALWKGLPFVEEPYASRWTTERPFEEPYFTEVKNGQDLAFKTNTFGASIYYKVSVYSDLDEGIVAQNDKMNPEELRNDEQCELYGNSIVVPENEIAKAGDYVLIQLVAAKGKAISNRVVNYYYQIANVNIGDIYFDDLVEFCGGRDAGFLTGGEYIENGLVPDDMSVDEFIWQKSEEIRSVVTIPSGLWMAVNKDATHVEYNGKAQKLDDVRVYDGCRRLEEKKDYTLQYKDNKDAGKATVIAKMKGNYAGTVEAKFTIDPINLWVQPWPEEATLLYAAGKTQKYNPKVQAMIEGKLVTLKAGKDYTLEYQFLDYDKGEFDPEATPYVDCGNYEIRIVGKGNYTGEMRSMEYIVVGTMINKASVKNLAKSYLYNEEGVVPTDTQLIMKGKPLNGVTTEEFDALNEEDAAKVDYTYYCYDNFKTGTATIVYLGVNDYCGVLTKPFKITGKDVKTLTVQGIQDVTYNGREIYQEIKVFDGNKVLDEHYYDPELDCEFGDYEVYWTNNRNVGKATATIVGFGAYEGVKKVDFKINKCDIAEAQIDMQDFCDYAKNGAKPEIWDVYIGDLHLAPSEYKVSYLNNKAPGNSGAGANAPTAVIQAKGKNFSGQAKRTFDIDEPHFDRVNMTATDVVYKEKANLCKPKVVIADSMGTKLAANKDYDKNLQYVYEEDTFVKTATGTVLRYMGEIVDPKDIVPEYTIIRVIAKGKGMYEGEELSTTFRYIAAQHMIGKLKITVDNPAYTGEDIELVKQKDIHVSAKNASGAYVELAGNEYEIVGYTNNYKVGAAKVTLRGVGSYGGTQTVSFKITAK